mgnify:CR=1 FL=1
MHSDNKPIIKMKYPVGIIKWIMKSPIFFYRLGLGMAARLFCFIFSIPLELPR